MKGLFGFLVFAMIMVCVSYADAQEVKTAQDDTAIKPQPAVVLIVDRNPKVQALQVFENGTLTNTFPVSTGRETFDFNEGNYKINPYCSFTETNEEYAKAQGVNPTPDFKVQRLREMNISDTWSTRDSEGNITSKTRMPHAVFFNGGTAFHAVDIETAYGKTAVTKLGPKESAANGGSGACVRLSPDNAKYVFDLF
ncbi:MAG: L,D-transpeptidase, partial [Bdellovibrionaceae bacterium]|nr:L,D-transpeptidase [Pseudobdellovibrionaceae bacterium]